MCGYYATTEVVLCSLGPARWSWAPCYAHRSHFCDTRTVRLNHAKWRLPYASNEHPSPTSRRLANAPRAADRAHTNAFQPSAPQPSGGLAAWTGMDGRLLLNSLQPPSMCMHLFTKGLPPASGRSGSAGSESQGPPPMPPGVRTSGDAVRASRFPASASSAPRHSLPAARLAWPENCFDFARNPFKRLPCLSSPS